MKHLITYQLPLIHAGMLIAFALIPVWYRFIETPAGFPPLYVSRFLILLPMLFTIALWLLTGLPGFVRLRRSRWGALWALMLLSLALWAFASTLWAFQRDNHPEVGMTAALQFGIMTLFAVACASTAPPPRRVISVLFLALLVNALITIGQVSNNGALGLRGLGEFTFNASSVRTSILRAGDLVYVRPYGLMPHPNALAGTLMIGLLAAGAWIISDQRRKWIGGAAILALGLWALLLTFSRAAWGGVAVGVIAILPFVRAYHRGRKVPSIALALVLALLIGGLFFVSYRPFLAARAGEGQESVELRSVSDRLVFIDFALRSIRERPVFGVGIGNFPWRTSYYIVNTFYDLRGDNVHHVLLSAWAELGTVGLVLLLLALVFGGIAAVKRLRDLTAFREDRAGRIALLAIMAALIAVGFLDHYPWTMIQFQVAWWGLMGALIHE